MSNLSKIEWHNPYKKIWGFHVHQELPFDDFIKALALQKAAASFLKENHIPIDNDDVLQKDFIDDPDTIIYMHMLYGDNGYPIGIAMVGFSELDKKLNQYWTDIYEKLLKIKSQKKEKSKSR